MRESLISILWEKNLDSHFGGNRAALFSGVLSSSSLCNIQTTDCWFQEQYCEHPPPTLAVSVTSLMRLKKRGECWSQLSSWVLCTSYAYFVVSWTVWWSNDCGLDLSCPPMYLKDMLPFVHFQFFSHIWFHKRKSFNISLEQLKTQYICSLLKDSTCS